MPSAHLILCRPLLLSPSIFPSIRVFFNESTPRISWLKYWSFSFSLSPFNEYSGLISFRIDWFDLLSVQGTREGIYQHHSLKASILWPSAFLMVQLSHAYMTSGKTIALTLQTFAGKVMSLLFNILSRFVILVIGRRWVGWIGVYIQQQICRHQRAGQRERWVAAGLGITSRNLGLSQELLCSGKS